jgi:hypothetical protein
MKRILLAGSAMLVLGVSASLAGDLGYGNDYYAPPASSGSGGGGPSGVFGDVNLSGTYTNGDVPSEFSLDLGGSVVLPLGNGWNAALDHQLGYRFKAGDWFAAGTGHFFYANQAVAGGAFVHADSDEKYGVGVEAAAFLTNVDLIGEVGYFKDSADYWGLAGTANVYFDPDTALSGTLGGALGDGDGWAADVGVEHRLANSPFSGFAEVGYTDLGGPDAYHVTGGARFVFGNSGSTLQEFNRKNPF